MGEAAKKIWVDADACPRVIKEILFRAVQRLGIPMTLVANRPLYIPPSELIDFLIVPRGFDEADAAIVDRVHPGDLVITEDIPFASEVIARGAVVLTPRGKKYDKGNIGEQLSMRDFMDDLRSAGVETGGPAAFTKKDRENFANGLQAMLVQGSI